MEKPTYVDTRKYPSIGDLSMNSKRIWGDAKHPTNANWYIQEKIDGSQLTVMVNPAYEAVQDDPDTKVEPLLFFNKGTPVAYTNKTFLKTINMLTYMAKTAKPDCNFDPQYTYHGEAVCSTRHNVAKYDRVPRYYFIIYDITNRNGTWLGPSSLGAEVARLGLEMTPILAWGGFGSANLDDPLSPYVECQQLIETILAGTRKSILGGMPEGVVLKHPGFINEKGKTVATKLKYVTPAFREAHAMKNKGEQATPESAVQEVGKAYSVGARFYKAVQHARDAGELKFDVTDAVKLKERLDDDFERERKPEAMNYLWAELAPHVKRACRTGFDEWYREYLAAMEVELQLLGVKDTKEEPNGDAGYYIIKGQEWTVTEKPN